jgi:hypothetical protein
MSVRLRSVLLDVVGVEGPRQTYQQTGVKVRTAPPQPKADRGTLRRLALAEFDRPRVPVNSEIKSSFHSLQAEGTQRLSTTPAGEALNRPLLLKKLT